jgi:glucose/arabinose dehydrogenase
MTDTVVTVNPQPACARSRVGARRLVPLLALPLLLWACSEQARLPDDADKGAKPTLPDPKRTLLPTVNIAPAVRWREGQTPQAAQGLAVRAFASGLEHPRWLHVLPNGDVLVAESNAPPRLEEGQGIKGWVMKKVMARAGAGVPSANRITLLRDTDGDGTAETRSVFLQGLNSPFGMALVGDRFYVAHTDAVWEYAYVPGAAQIAGGGRKLTDLPGGPRNHHWTKSLIASADGSKLYATVGSNSNVAENGMAVEEGRAAIWEIDRASGAKRLFASGLRNPNGMAWTADGKLWTVVNERDELGSDLVPDYLTSVKDGGFYGWPYSWYGSYVDPRVSPPRPDLVAQAIAPDYALGAHVAPLGLAAAAPGPLTAALAVAGAPSAPIATAAPASATAASALASAAATAAAPVHGMFIGLHGSWNRQPLSGYKVVYVAFEDGKPIGLPRDVLTGFVNAEGDALGRPVGVAMDSHGALLVADDVGNAVWRVMPR